MLLSPNHKARHNYILKGKTLEVGIKLTGAEVKSIRQANSSVSFQDAYVAITKGTLMLHNAHIPPYSHSNVEVNPKRPRILLAHKSEILELQSILATQPLTLVPLGLKFSRDKIKLVIDLGQGKNHKDKRDSLKEKAVLKEVRKIIKNNRASI